MNKLSKIIEYFFHHDVNDAIKEKVYSRMLSLEDDDEKVRDETLRSIWDNACGDTSSVNVEDEYRKMNTELFGRQHTSLFRTIARIAALWLIPILLMGTGLYAYIVSEKVTNEYANVKVMQISTLPGERKVITLPDRTKVWLNSGSTLIYPSQFVGAERRVSLSGEGFFSVAKDRRHPFILVSNHFSLQVLGTTFNVTSFPDEIVETITLETGSVDVTTGNNRHSKMEQGDQLVYSPTSDKVEISKVNVHNYSSWREGALYFSNETLQSAILKIERAYGVRIRLMTVRYDKQRIHANFEKDEKLLNVMNVLKNLIPGMKFNIIDRTVYIE